MQRRVEQIWMLQSFLVNMDNKRHALTGRKLIKKCSFRWNTFAITLNIVYILKIKTLKIMYLYTKMGVIFLFVKRCQRTEWPRPDWLSCYFLFVKRYQRTEWPRPDTLSCYFLFVKRYQRTEWPRQWKEQTRLVYGGSVWQVGTCATNRIEKRRVRPVVAPYGSV